MRLLRTAKFHWLAGTLAVVPLGIAFSTGIVLGLKDWVSYLRFPFVLEISDVQKLAPSITPELLIQRAKRQFPAWQLKAFHPAEASDRSVQVRLYLPPNQAQQKLVFLDPKSGTLLESRDVVLSSTWQFIYNLHRGIWAGLYGQILMASAALLFVALASTGAWMALKRFRASGTRSRWTIEGRLAGSIHHNLGLLLGALGSMWVVLGAVLNFSEPLKKTFDPMPSFLNLPTRLIQDDLPTSEILKIARKAYGPEIPEGIYFSSRQNEPVLVYYRVGGRLYLNAVDGSVIRARRPESHWTSALYPLHSGRWIGKLGPPILSILALALLMLTLSGLFLRYQRGKV